MKLIFLFRTALDRYSISHKTCITCKYLRGTAPLFNAVCTKTAYDVMGLGFNTNCFDYEYIRTYKRLNIENKI